MLNTETGAGHTSRFPFVFYHLWDKFTLTGRHRSETGMVGYYRKAVNLALKPPLYLNIQAFPKGRDSKANF